MRKILYIAAFICFSATTQMAWADSFKAGITSYLAKDYPAALRQFQIAAEQGNAGAQYFLGDMHYYGRGTPQDDGQALRVLRSLDSPSPLTPVALMTGGVPSHAKRARGHTQRLGRMGTLSPFFIHRLEVAS